MYFILRNNGSFALALRQEHKAEDDESDSNLDAREHEDQVGRMNSTSCEDDSLKVGFSFSLRAL